MRWLFKSQVDRLVRLVEDGHFGRARKVADRLARKNPGDGDVRFLRIVTLNQLDEHRRVLDDAEDAKQHVPEAHLSGIAYIAAHSAIDLGRENDAARWVRVAERDPEFAEKVRSEPHLSQLHRDAAFQ